MPELMPSFGIERARLAQKLHLDMSSERQIHVVAAQHQVVADRQSIEAQPFFPLADGDNGEIGGAAPHVTDQNDLSRRHLLPPVRLVPRQPGIEGGQWLLDQHHPGQPGLARGRDGQFARHLVK